MHETKRLRAKKAYVIVSCLLLVAATLLTVALIRNKALTLTEYEITDEALPNGFDGYRILQISDLHNTAFGAQNRRLLDRMAAARPDAIVFTGDLIDSRRPGHAVASELAKKAMEIAPCYYVTGNHEARSPEYQALKTELAALGVIILQNTAVTLTAGEDSISLLGLADPAFTPDTDAEAAIDEALASIPQTDGFRLLLSHRPEHLSVYAKHGVSLVLSGHAHGGQIRLPLLGGVIAPGQGLFPAYTEGIHTEGETRMIVSRGLGNSIFPLRINNPPELVLVILAQG